MTAFNEGQTVTANVTAQGMTKGNEYKIVKIIKQEMMWGTFVQYILAGNAQECKDGLLQISNGHILLNGAN
jgi:hypothetical protein